MHERVIAAGILLLVCAGAGGARTPSRDARLTFPNLSVPGEIQRVPLPEPGP